MPHGELELVELDAPEDDVPWSALLQERQTRAEDAFTPSALTEAVTENTFANGVLRVRDLLDTIHGPPVLDP
jgi:hypothetical protein